MHGEWASEAFWASLDGFSWHWLDVLWSEVKTVSDANMTDLAVSTSYCEAVLELPLANLTSSQKSRRYNFLAVSFSDILTSICAKYTESDAVSI